MAFRADRSWRITDRVEDVAAWVLLAAGMLLIAVSCAVGLGTSSTLAERARVEAQDHVPGVARLLVASPTLPGEYTTSTPMMVPASWQDRWGVENTGLVSAPQGLQAGRTVKIWTDRVGAAVPAPVSTTDVLIWSIVAGGLVLGLGAAVLAGLWATVRRVTLAYNCARWAREWSEVGPVWSQGEGRRS